MDPRKIVVKNIPPCCNDTLENFIEVVSDNGIVDVYFYNDDMKDIALVTMEEDVTDIQKIQQKAKKRKLEGKEVDIVQAQLHQGILVSDLPPKVTRDTLMFYFEKSSSGGEDEGVADCELYERIGLAKVIFINHTIANQVLGVQSHKPMKSQTAPVSLKPYYPEFHDEVLELLEERAGREVVREESESAVERPQVRTVPRLAGYEEVVHISRSNDYESVQSTLSGYVDPRPHEYGDGLLRTNTSLYKVIEYSPKKTPSEDEEEESGGGSPQGRVKSPTSFYDLEQSSEVEKTRLDDRFPQTESASSSGDADIGRYFGRGDSPELEDVSMVSLSKNDGDTGNSEMESVDDTVLFQPKQFKGNIQNEAYQRSSVTKKSTHPPLAPKPKPKPKQKYLKAFVKFPPANTKLLEFSKNVDEDFPSCKISYDLGSGMIKLEGPESEIQKAQLQLYEENNNISSMVHKVDQKVADIMSTEKGKNCIDQEVGRGRTLWYLEKDQVHCVAFSEDECKLMITKIKRLIQEDCVNYADSNHFYLKGTQWSDKKQSLERDRLVRVLQDTGSIRIVGLGGDVDKSKRDIEVELKTHAHLTRNYDLAGVMAKCLKKFFQTPLVNIKRSLCDAGGRWDDFSTDLSLSVKFEGPPDAVKKVGSALKDLEKKLWHETLKLGKDVAKEKDLNLLIRMMQREDLRVLQASFEARHPVFLEMNLPSTKKLASVPPKAHGGHNTGRLYRAASMTNLDLDEPEELTIFETPRIVHDRERMSMPRPRSPPRQMTTSITTGNITINVKKGDITKEKTDVIVNVVGKDLNAQGTEVSKAFVKAAGREFLMSFEMAKQSWQDGSVIQTKASGNLSAKFVYTVAVDKWNPPGSKTELKGLMDACLKTAANNGCTSIAISAVGCGKLFKFPVKYVASCLVSSVKANSKLSLQTVNLVLFDQGTYQAFLYEINPKGATLPHSRSSPYTDPFDRPVIPSASMSVGGTAIKVEQGDITKHKATVLVNVVTEDVSMRSTAVSKAFVRAGGDTLVEEFEANKDKPARSNLIVTSGGGNLKCDYVYHLVIRRGANDEYQDVISECFKLAGGYNTRSIAFPSVGCGVLFKFMPHFVADCLVSAAKASSIPNVTFVIYDQPVMDVFTQQLQDSGDSSGAENLGVLRKYAKSSQTDRVPTSDNKAANIIIWGANKQTCTAAKDGLGKELKANFLHSEIIQHENLVKLSGKNLQSLQEAADKNGIWIKFPDPDKKKKATAELKLKGNKNTVLLVKSKIQQVLMDTMKRSGPKPTYVPRGTLPHLQEMASMFDFTSPGYWTKFKAKTPLRELANSLRKFIGMGPKTKKPYELVDVDQKTFNAIDTLVQKTWDATLVGHGKDAVGLGHQGIKVLKVERLEHPDMFTKYCQKRSTRFGDACVRKGPFDALNKLPGSKSAAKTTMFAPPELQVEVYPEINEHYFFHGTKPENVDSIIAQGLDSRVGNQNAMFGTGVYGAESSTKADQYTDDKTNRTPGQKKMVLMRMTLGHPYVTSNPNKYCRPPCKVLTHLDDKCNKGHDMFHSVIGDGKWLFREFVVYEPDLCYPEYLITYNRV